MNHTHIKQYFYTISITYIMQQVMTVLTWHTNIWYNTHRLISQKYFQSTNLCGQRLPWPFGCHSNAPVWPGCHRREYAGSGLSCWMSCHHWSTGEGLEWVSWWREHSPLEHILTVIRRDEVIYIDRKFVGTGKAKGFIVCMLSGAYSSRWQCH